jgi:hypothetical protein
MKKQFQKVATVVFLLPLIGVQSAGMAAESAASLSGDYRLHFEQSSKSCGAEIGPVEANVTLDFSESSVAMSFPSGFLGINFLEAEFDPQTGTVNDHLEQRVSLGPTEATLTLDIEGSLVSQGDNIEIHYEVSFDKIADDPAWNCKVTGKGRMIKL